MALRAGIKQQGAYALFRVPTGRAYTTPLKADLSLLAIEIPTGTDTVIHFIDTLRNTISSIDKMQVRSETPRGTASTLETTTTIAKYVRKKAKNVYCRTMV